MRRRGARQCKECAASASASADGEGSRDLASIYAAALRKQAQDQGLAPPAIVTRPCVRCHTACTWPSEAEAAASGSAGPQRVRIALDEGGVATSGITKRRWAGGHHLIDPSTGRPADTGIERVTVIAAETWWAEVVATAIAVSSVADGLELLDGLSLPGRVTLTCGEEVASPDWAVFLVDPAEIGTRS